MAYIFKNETEEKVYRSLDLLMEACNLEGESGTEVLFDILYQAVQSVDRQWHVIERSHKDGLCYDVNTMLTEEILKFLSKRSVAQTFGTQEVLSN
jgi:hypothetical protein